MQEYDLFGDPIIKNPLLRDKFMEPPFSVLNTMGGAWQNRKRQWKELGIESEKGRDHIEGTNVLKNGFNAEKYGRTGTTSSEGTGTSIFDPALTELMYRWFCLPGSKIFDPFAGGSVRGIVANYLGFDYWGVELRSEQVDSNNAQAEQIIPDRKPKWLVGDTDKVIAPGTAMAGYSIFDFLFTCPPYHDLEIYSNNPDDLSNMPYDQFIEKYRRIIKQSVGLLKPNSFAVIIVGDMRDEKGFYRNFNGHTKQAFIDAGANLYNEAKLLQPLGSAMLRANRTFSSGKKLIKVHEDVLIFYKGDPKMIRDKFKMDENIHAEY